MSLRGIAGSRSTPTTLPLGWAMTTLGEIVEASPEKIDPADNPDSPYVGLEHIESGTKRLGGIGKAADVRSAKSVFRAGDVLFGKLRPYLNKVVRPDFDGVCSTDILVLRATERVDSAFIEHLVSRPQFIEFAMAHSAGINLPRTSYKKLAEYPVRLPPPADQRRIVARLEALEARSRRAREKLAAVPAQLAQARQSLLAAAFRGDGSTQSETWIDTIVGEISENIRYGYTASAKTTATDTRLLRITDIQNGCVDWSSVPFASIPVTEAEKYLLKRGDIVFARTGATTGKSFLIGNCPRAVFASYLIRVRTSKSVLPEFLALFFQSPAYWQQISENVAGVAQPSCNASKLERLKISTPPIPEQHEIVCRLTAALAKLDAAAAAHAAAVAALDRLDQSLLARAFSGGLVPPEAAPSLAPATPSVSVQAQLYLLRFIPALLRAAGQPVSLADLNAVVALRFLPATVLLPVVERLGGAPARAHFAASASVAYEDGTFLAVMQRLRRAGAIVASPDRRGVSSLSLGSKPPPSTPAVDADARHLAPLLSRVPVARVEPILRRLQSAEVQEALLTTP